MDDATGEQVLRFRVRAQQLDRRVGDLDDTAVLDVGVQDSGADGASWALANRGVVLPRPGEGSPAGRASRLATVWTVRGAPHVHRRADLIGVAAATAPFSEADAARRVFDAAKPLRAAGMPVTAALDEIAEAMREEVAEPLVKGEVSRRLTARMSAVHLRDCRPCGATHLYENPFRLAALRGGLELRAGTSPPVLQRIPGHDPAAVPSAPPPRLDQVRGYLRLLGPATPRHVASYLDAPVADVKAHWPDDAVEVTVDGVVRWLLADDAPRLLATGAGAGTGAGEAKMTRLLGPFDLFTQARDRDVLVGDAARAKELWPVLGRPGAVLHDGALVGTWRPRKSGARLAVAVRSWSPPSAALRAGVEEQAERLAAHRRARLAAVEING